MDTYSKTKHENIINNNSSIIKSIKMKTNRLYPFLAILVLLFTSCSIDHVSVSADDTVTYKHVAISDYDSVEIANGFNAYIEFSETEESIEIEANENLQQLIIGRIENNKLTVKVKNNVNVRGDATLNVYIKTKSINNFKVSADAKIILENTLNTSDASIYITADSYFAGNLEVENLELYATADARAELNGHVNDLNANLSADAQLADYNLVVEDLKIKMTADCDAFLTISNTIYIDANADCMLSYKGNPTITHQHLTADSKIKKVN
jgi:hypothetical protein